MEHKDKKEISSEFYNWASIKLGLNKPRNAYKKDLKFEIIVRRISIILVLSWVLGGVLWAWIQTQ